MFQQLTVGLKFFQLLLSEQFLLSELDALWDAVEAAGWACAGSIIGCVMAIASGGWAVWACALTVGACMRLTQKAADKLVAYWNCKDRHNNTTAYN